MQFINILMLGGLAAVAIPIIIQLLTRKNVRRMPWGAWLFLDKAMKKRKRKILLEDILLLACRCLALALLALAFARPFMRPDSPVPWTVTLPLLLMAIISTGVSLALWRYPRWRKGLFYGGLALFALVVCSIIFERQLNLKRFGRDATKDIVLVIDASASMSLENDEKSNLERAIEETRKYIANAPENTSFSVIIGGSVPQVLNDVPVSDRRIVLNALDSVAKRYADGRLKGSMQIGSCLTAAGVVLQAGHNAVKQIVIVGDGQTVGWHLDDSERWKTLKHVFATLNIDPIITWRTLPLPISIRNLTVASVRPARDVVGTDREVTFEVTVVNAGTEVVTPRGVTFVAGTDRKTITDVRQIEPGERQVFTFKHRFARAGGATVTARVDCEDDIPADNEYEYAMPVIGSLRVLLIDGEGRGASGTKINSAAYLNLALRPQLIRAAANTSSDAPARDFLIETVVEDAIAAANRTTFSDFAAVILSGVRWLPEKSMDTLAGFVHGGGGVMVLPGMGMDGEAFAKWTLNGEKLLPAPVGTWRDNESPVDPSAFRDILHRFRAGSDLGGAVPRRVMKFGETWEEGTEILAGLEDGSPFILSRRFGSGRVIETAAPFDALSGLVSKRTFLPLVHELTYALARPMAVTLDVNPSEGLTVYLGRTARVNGLLGFYYPMRGYKGTPVHRLDPNVDFNWGTDSPLPDKEFPVDNFSVVWRGVLTPPVSGKYKLGWDVDDRLTVMIGNQMIRQWGMFDLTAGRSYAFVARYEEFTGQARVSFRWQLPNSRELVVVPSDVFRAQVAGSEGAGELVQVKDPYDETFDGEIYQSGDGLYLHITRSIFPGKYKVEGVPELIKPWITNALTDEGALFFTVSSEAEESSILAITQSELMELCDYVKISQALKEEDVINAINGQGFGKEIWRLLALIAFLFLVLEPAIARWIAINRRTGDIIDTEGTWIK